MNMSAEETLPEHDATDLEDEESPPIIILPAETIVIPPNPDPPTDPDTSYTSPAT